MCGAATLTIDYDNEILDIACKELMYGPEYLEPSIIGPARARGVVHRVHIDHIYTKKWIPSASSGYVDVDGLYNASYQLVSLNDSQDPILVSYANAFNDKIKINGVTQKYAKLGLAPTGHKLHTLDSPGKYYLVKPADGSRIYIYKEGNSSSKTYLSNPLGTNYPMNFVVLEC